MNKLFYFSDKVRRKILNFARQASAESLHFSKYNFPCKFEWSFQLITDDIKYSEIYNAKYSLSKCNFKPRKQY